MGHSVRGSYVRIEQGLISDTPYASGGVVKVSGTQKYGCGGTVTARFALIAFVAWKRLADSTLGKLWGAPRVGLKCP